MATTNTPSWNPHKIPTGISFDRDNVTKDGTLVKLDGKPIGRVSRDSKSKAWSGVTMKGAKISDQGSRLAVTNFLTEKAGATPQTLVGTSKAEKPAAKAPKAAAKPTPKAPAKRTRKPAASTSSTPAAPAETPSQEAVAA
jgi:hypothetical protein